MESPVIIPRRIPQRVLLIVDDPMKARILENQLTGQGMEVYRARDTMEARSLWLPNFYHSVVIGIRKENPSGIVRRIREDAPTQPITFVTQTNLTDGPKRHPQSVKQSGTLDGRIQSSARKAKVIEMPKRREADTTSD
jgi:CheY-like chemotaxis protein